MKLSAGLYKAFPNAVALIGQKQDLHRAAGGYTFSKQPCRDNTRVIHHKAIAFMEEVQNIIKMTVLKRTVLLVQNKQA